MRYRFDPFELDVARRELTARGRPVGLPPRAFDLLAYLVENRDRVVSKRELLDTFWPADVSEGALQKAISLMRKACAGIDGAGELVKTHHGRGFRFIAAVEEPRADGNEPVETAAPRLQRLVAVLAVRLIHDSEEHARGADPRDPIATARDVVEAYQGRLGRMLFGGFTVLFGAGDLYEDSARRAVGCAARIVAEAAETDSPPCVCCAVETAVETVDATRETDDWTLPTATEKAAVGLAEMARPGEILLSRATREHLRDEVEAEPCDDGFRLLSPPRPTSGVPGRPLKSPSAFVGRMAEMAFLRTHLEIALERAGQAVVLSGPPGIGKTRLCAEFLLSLDSSTAGPVLVRCLPSLRNTPLAAIRQLIGLLDVPETAVRDGIDIVLMDDLRSGLDARRAELDVLSDHQRTLRRHDLLRRILKQLAGKHPLLVVFEDVHWMDATSRHALEALIPGIESTRILLVITTRPTADPPPAESVLQLSPLGRSDSFDLLRNSPDMPRLGEAAAARLVDRAGGNPFFLEELALAAQIGADPTSHLPDTVQAVIGVRIGGLDAAARALLHVVAVIGPPAPVALAAFLVDRDDSAARDGLVRLVRRGFLVEDDGGFAFRHMLIQDTAYASIASDDRRRLHERIAEHLEQRAPDEAVRPERLAWHHQEAGHAERAVPYWLRASREALHRSAREEAVAFARAGLALIDPEDPATAPRELEFQLCLGPALTALRGFGAEEVGAAYYRAQELSRAVSNVKAEVRILVGLWIHSWVSGRLSESLGHGDRLLALAERSSQPALLQQAHASLGQVLMHKGELGRAHHHLTEGLRSIADSPPTTVPSQNSAVSCAAYASWVASLLGRSEEAERLLRTSHALAEEGDDPYAKAIHYALCTEHFMFENDIDGCSSYADRAIEISAENDFAFWLGTGLVMRGWSLGRRGELAAAFESIDEGIEIFEATGAGVQLANWYGLRAETLLAASRLEDALEAALHALACADRAEDMYFAPRLHSTIAAIHDASGQLEAAKRHRETGRELARRFGLAERILSVNPPHPDAGV